MFYDFLATIVGVGYVDLFLSGFNDFVVFHLICILSHKGSQFSLHFILSIKVAKNTVAPIVKVKEKLIIPRGFTYPQ
jgi:hypothetical protein